MPSKVHSDADINACLQYVATSLKRSPLSTEYATYYESADHPSVNISLTTVRRRHGTWNAALIAAGLEGIPEVSLMNIAKCLVAAAKRTGRAPNTTEYDRLFSAESVGIFISRQTIITTFGTWRRALRFAGLEISSVCRKSRTIRIGDSTPRQPVTRLNPKAVRESLGPPRFLDERLLSVLLLLVQAEELVERLADDGALQGEDPRVDELSAIFFQAKREIVEASVLQTKDER